jgi:hypothetical protein
VAAAGRVTPTLHHVIATADSAPLGPGFFVCLSWVVLGRLKLYLCLQRSLLFALADTHWFPDSNGMCCEFRFSIAVKTAYTQSTANAPDTASAVHICFRRNQFHCRCSIIAALYGTEVQMAAQSSTGTGGGLLCSLSSIVMIGSTKSSILMLARLTSRCTSQLQGPDGHFHTVGVGCHLMQAAALSNLAVEEVEYVSLSLCIACSCSIATLTADSYACLSQCSATSSKLI